MGYAQYSALAMNRRWTQGASVFELFVFILLFSFLVAVSHCHHVKIEKRYDYASVEHLAGVFARAVTTVASTRGLSGQGSYRLNEKWIYLNEHGWPANTDSQSSPLSSNQTPEECLQLWQVLLDEPPPASIYASTNATGIRFYIYSINANKCRYLYAKDLVAPLYFDYALSNGSVVLSWQKQSAE